MPAERDVGWSFSDPSRPHPGGVVIDDHSAAVVAEATVTLTLLRSPMRLGDHLAELHATVSLLAQLDAQVPTIVAAARDQGHSWSAISGQLGITPGAARRRYRHRETTNTTNTIDTTTETR